MFFTFNMPSQKPDEKTVLTREKIKINKLHKKSVPTRETIKRNMLDKKKTLLVVIKVIVFNSY